MIGNNVEKYRFVVLNIKLQVKLRFKTLTFKTVTYRFRFKHHYQYSSFCSKLLHILATNAQFKNRN